VEHLLGAGEGAQACLDPTQHDERRPIASGEGEGLDPAAWDRNRLGHHRRPCCQMVRDRISTQTEVTISRLHDLTPPV
jgi:hypothetical protein